MSEKKWFEKSMVITVPLGDLTASNAVQAAELDRTKMRNRIAVEHFDFDNGVVTTAELPAVEGDK